MYDETIQVLSKAIQQAKIGQSDKQQAIHQLSVIARNVEKDFVPNDNFEALVKKERRDSWKYGGKTVFGDAKPIKEQQLSLF